MAEANGAPAALAAKKELVEGEILPKRYPPRMRMTPSGEAIVCFREAEWVEDGVTNRWEQVAADLATNTAVLGRIRIAMAKPVLDNHVDLSLGPKLSFSHVAPVKALSYWFGAASQLALHEGRTREALGDLLVQIELPRLLAEDRLGISELVRIALAGIARASTREALQAEGWTDEDLARLQAAWERQSFASGKLPESLDTLVPEFLHTVPVDYMDGKPVRYRLKVDGNYLLYSVGADGKDDGGDSRLSAGKTNARVYWDRRDFVWPTPAASP